MSGELELLGASITLAFFRALGLVALLPLGAHATYAALRLMIALGLALFSLTHIPQRLELSIIDPLMEFVIGLCLSLPTALALSVVAMWAEWNDVLRGQTLGAILDPLSEQQEGAATVLMRTMVWALLLAAGFGTVLVETFDSSLQHMVIGSMRLSSLTELATQVSFQTLRSLELVTLLVLPLAFVALLIEIGAGWINRLLPQATFSHEVFLIKSVALLVVMMSGWQHGLFDSIQSIADLAHKRPAALHASSFVR